MKVRGGWDFKPGKDAQSLHHYTPGCLLYASVLDRWPELGQHMTVKRVCHSYAPAGRITNADQAWVGKAVLGVLEDTLGRVRGGSRDSDGLALLGWHEAEFLDDVAINAMGDRALAKMAQLAPARSKLEASVRRAALGRQAGKPTRSAKARAL